MYVYTHMYIHTYIHIYVYIYTYIYTNIYAPFPLFLTLPSPTAQSQPGWQPMHMGDVCICIYTYMYVHSHTHTHTLHHEVWTEREREREKTNPSVLLSLFLALFTSLPPSLSLSLSHSRALSFSLSPSLSLYFSPLTGRPATTVYGHITWPSCVCYLLECKADATVTDKMVSGDGFLYVCICVYIYMCACVYTVICHHQVTLILKPQGVFDVRLHRLSNKLRCIISVSNSPVKNNLAVAYVVQDRKTTRVEKITFTCTCM